MVDEGTPPGSITVLNDISSTASTSGGLKLQTEASADKININTGTVTTHGQQDYAGAVAVGANTSLTSSDNVDFESTVDGPDALTVSASGTNFSGAVGGTPLSSLSLTGPASLAGGSVQTTGDQTYDGSVSLGNNASLTSTGGAVNLAGVDGNDALTVDATGVSFGGAVGSSMALSSLSVTGPTSIAGVPIQTSGAQTYNNAVTLTSGTSTFTTTTNNNVRARF